MKQSRFCDTLVATTVDYPFAYRTEKESNNAGLTKLVTTKVYHVKHVNRDSTIKNKTFLKRIFSSKVLVLLALGFIAGSVFPFVVPCIIVDNTAAPVTVVPEEFLADEVVKNLARENQVHEKEISKLKQQVKIQSIQQGIIERLEGTIDADPQQSQEANLDIEHPDNEAIILGRVNEKTGQFELYDHNEHRYKPIQQRRLRASSKLAA